MWHEMEFVPEIEVYGDRNNCEPRGEVIKSAKHLLLDFLNNNRIRDYEIADSYDMLHGNRYLGDTHCYQVFYYNSSANSGRNRKI